MSVLLSALNDDKKITYIYIKKITCTQVRANYIKNIFFHIFYLYFFTLTRFKAVKCRHHIFYYIYYSPLFIISEPILSICLSNASSAFFPILENLPLSQFHILLHPLTFTRGCS